jgi:hypothetical protein
MKKLIYLILGLLVGLSLSSTQANAAEFKVASEGGNVSISEGEKVKNLYTAGNIVSIDGEVEKSLYAAGSTVQINGNVEDNVCAGAFSVVLRGKVGGSMHTGGSNVLIEGEVADDLFIGGGFVTVAKSARVGGDLVIGGGVINIEAPIGGNVYLAGGQATINSKIEGQVQAEVDELRLGSQAEIGKELVYKSEKEASLAEEAKVAGEVKFERTEKKKTPVPARAKFRRRGLLSRIGSIGFLIKLLMSLVIALALVYPLKKVTKPVVKEALAKFWASLGIGFVSLFLTPIAGVILLVTVLGVWLGGLVFIVYGLGLFLSLPLASVSLGSWLLKTYRKEDYRLNWQVAVAGALAMNFIGLVPYVGWLAVFALMLVGFGSLYRVIYQSLIAKK